MKKLDYSYVSKYFRDHECKLLETHYTGALDKMQYMCSCGKKSTTTWSRFSSGCRCRSCGIKNGSAAQSLNHEYVNEFFSQHGCKLLDRYKNRKTKMRYVCKCGRTWYAKWGNFRNGPRCKKCASASIRGENHPHWNKNRDRVKLNHEINRRCRDMLRHTLCSVGKIKSCKSEVLLGYNRSALRDRLISHPVWTEVCDKKWSVDHVFPIMAFLDHGIDDLKIINRLDNLRPMLLSENSSKNDTYCEEDFLTWLRLSQK
jgi:hypothetical protein